MADERREVVRGTVLGRVAAGQNFRSGAALRHRAGEEGWRFSLRAPLGPLLSHPRLLRRTSHA